MCYGRRPPLPQEWSSCSYLFGVGEAPEGDAHCSSLYYEGNDDEVDVGWIEALLEDGTITDETLIYSSDSTFPYGDWVRVAHRRSNYG
jgi:hypothetical protein